MSKRWAILAVSCLILSGCSSLGGGNLLESPQFAAVPQVPSLATPPDDALQPATAANAAELEEVISTTPSVAALDATKLPGIDAAKTAASLEDDVAAAKVSPTVVWRGMRSAGNVDIANANGTLCSGARDQGNDTTNLASRITLACSDGRIAELMLSRGKQGFAKVSFNGKTEDVDLRQ